MHKTYQICNVKVISHKVQQRHLAEPVTTEMAYVFCHLLLCLHREVGQHDEGAALRA